MMMFMVDKLFLFSLFFLVFSCTDVKVVSDNYSQYLNDVEGDCDCQAAIIQDSQGYGLLLRYSKDKLDYLKELDYKDYMLKYSNEFFQVNQRERYYFTISMECSERKSNSTSSVLLYAERYHN